MNVEERHWFDAQMLRIQQTAAVIAERQVEFQALPIGQPDSVPKRQWVQKKKHGKADARALTTAELSMRAEHPNGLSSPSPEATSEAMPTPTAPGRLERDNRGKMKRKHIRKYKKAVQTGLFIGLAGGGAG